MCVYVKGAENERRERERERRGEEAVLEINYLPREGFPEDSLQVRGRRAGLQMPSWALSKSSELGDTSSQSLLVKLTDARIEGPWSQGWSWDPLRTLP